MIPDLEPRRFFGPLRSAALVSAIVLSCPAVGAAQSPDALHVGVYAGPLQHSLLGLVNGTLWSIGANGLAVDADVEAESSTLLGAQLARALTSSLEIRLRVARAATHMRLYALTWPIGGTGTQTFTFDGLGDVTVWLLDVDLRWVPWRSPVPITPYLVGGVGVANWDISGLEDLGALPPLLESPVNLNDVNAFLPGAVVGIGLEIGSFGPMALELELADHLSGDPLDDDDFYIGTEFAGHGRAKDLVHNLSFTAGIRVKLGY